MNVFYFVAFSSLRFIWPIDLCLVQLNSYREFFFFNETGTSIGLLHFLRLFIVHCVKYNLSNSFKYTHHLRTSLLNT